MNKKQKIKEIITLLEAEYPKAGTALRHKNPLQLLIATILSAQCTDKRVNQVTPKLYRKYKSAQDYARADIKKLQEDIKSTGFYRNKAKNIKKCCMMLVDEYRGQVPDSMQELVKLPGVARKTANIVLGHGYGKTEGIAVDTHVMRLSKRLGLTAEKNRDKIEQNLMAATPKEYWIKLTDLLIMHGRNICKARKPRCGECKLQHLCSSAFTHG